jgi:hypothetical protein
MRAKPGDWLVVEITGTDHDVRRARIEEVRSADGTPPFLVRWLDTGRTGLVFPGPDAHVMTQDEVEARDARAAARAAVVQQRIVYHGGKP